MASAHTLSADDDGGFTLIELLVVVIIIGILAGIAIPQFVSQRERGWQAQLTSDVRNAIYEVESAFVGDSMYPADQAAFDALGQQVSSPAITMTYEVSAGRDAFCVLGTDSRLPTGSQIASYVAGGSVQYLADCPPL